jgi:radical SAM superfamily enzyme YgiQ (UPF0313 family)
MSIDLREKRKKILARETRLIPEKKEGLIRIALIFPNHYFLGMANLGFQTAFRLFNREKAVICERAFLPEPDEEKELIRKKRPLFTLESGRPLSSFDIVAFSSSYELDYPNMVKILNLAGIPPYADQRSKETPLIILGGVSSFLNPEPIAPFMDIILVGEGELLIPLFIESYLRRKKDKQAIKKALAPMLGFYVPSLYSIEYNGEGEVISFSQKNGASPKIRRAIALPLPDPPSASSAIITPDAEFGRTLLIELSRGCGSACFFCFAGYNYLPRREHRAKGVIARIEEAKGSFDKIGLIASSITDYSERETLFAALSREAVEVTVSSLRLDFLDEAWASFLAERGLKTATIAPETGSEKLRFSINKKITDSEILEKVGLITSAGIKNIKLYYIFGLPGEKEGDLEKTIKLTAEIKRIMKKRGGKRLSASISPFIPKPHTPFQWEEMADTAVLKKRLTYLRKELSSLKVEVSGLGLREALRQGVLSRGDRRLAPVIISLARKESLNNALSSTGLYKSAFLRPRGHEERLPWDHIGGGIDKEKLSRLASLENNEK